MKTIKLAVIALIISVLFLLGCGKKGEVSDATVSSVSSSKENPKASDSSGASVTADPEDGRIIYTPESGDFYIGFVVTFEDRDELCIYTICNGKTIADCATDFPERDFFVKDELIGMTYDDAFSFIYEKFMNGKTKPVERIGYLLLFGTDPDKFEKSITDLRDTLTPGAKIDHSYEEKERFIQKIREYTEQILEEEALEQRIEEERLRLEEEHQRDLERQEEERRQDEKRRQEEEERLRSPSKSTEDVLERIEKSQYDITLGADVTLDMSRGITREGIVINAEGHSVKLTGTYTSSGKPDSAVTVFIINGASSVDLSGFSVNTSVFNDNDWMPENGNYGEHARKHLAFVEVRNTPASKVKLPNIPMESEFDGKIAPFEGFFACVQHGSETNIEYIGPASTYEARQEKETDVVTALFTNGDYSYLDHDTYRVDENIWTDVSVNVGSVSLPNRDYKGLELKPGASLKLSGTIAVTGGRLCFSVCESDQLDLTGLTLIKSHPSPDMVKVTYNPSAGLNTSLLEAKASSGTVKYDLSSKDFCITIW